MTDITNLTIKLPYTDWSEARKLGSGLSHDDAVLYRFRALMGLPTKPERTGPVRDTWAKPIEIQPLSETQLLTLPEVRRLINIRLCQTVESHFPAGGRTIMLETGLNNTILSRYLKSIRECTLPISDIETPNGIREQVPSMDIRPFTTPLTYIPAIAEYVTKCTAHELLFGEPGRIVLPTLYSTIANGISFLSEKSAASLIEAGRKMMGREIDDCSAICAERKKPNLTKYGQTKTATQLIYERMNEMMDENGHIRGPKYILSESTGGIDERLKYNLKQMTDQTTVASDGYEPSLDLIIFLALETGQAADFFLRNDYINIAGGASRTGKPQTRIEILTKTKDGNKPVTDTVSLQILSFCLALSGDNKYKYIGRVLSCMLKGGYVPTNAMTEYLQKKPDTSYF